jgi:hypothetical protein
MARSCSASITGNRPCTAQMHNRKTKSLTSSQRAKRRRFTSRRRTKHRPNLVRVENLFPRDPIEPASHALCLWPTLAPKRKNRLHYDKEV